MRLIHFLCFIAACVTISAMVQVGYEKYLLHSLERAETGHLCSRMFRKGYFSGVDLKYMNYGWMFMNKTHIEGIENDLLQEYNDYFYQVPDKDIFYQNALPKMKVIIADIKENGARDIFHDIMQVVRDNVNVTPWLEKSKHRKQVWDTYWKNRNQ